MSCRAWGRAAFSSLSGTTSSWKVTRDVLSPDAITSCRSSFVVSAAARSLAASMSSFLSCGSFSSAGAATASLLSEGTLAMLTGEASASLAEDSCVGCLATASPLGCGEPSGSKSSSQVSCLPRLGAVLSTGLAT